MRFVKRKLREKDKLYRVQLIFEAVVSLLITSVLLIWSQVANHAAQRAIGEDAQRPMLVNILTLILSG